MAYEKMGLRMGAWVAGADYRTTGQHRFVRFSTAAGNTILLCALGEAADGVLLNEPNIGEPCDVQVDGVAKVRAGGTVANGAAVTSDANGDAVTATLASTDTLAGAAADALVGSNVNGKAISGGADDELISVLLQTRGAAPTTLA